MQKIIGTTTSPELSESIKMMNTLNEQAREIESLKAKCDYYESLNQILMDERFEAQRAAREAAAKESAEMWERIESTMDKVARSKIDYREEIIHNAAEASQDMFARHTRLERLIWKIRHPIKNKWDGWTEYITERDAKRNYWLIKYNKAVNG